MARLETGLAGEIWAAATGLDLQAVLPGGSVQRGAHSPGAFLHRFIFMFRGSNCL